MLLAAMNDVEPSESGLASGVINTSFMMGGALGLAILASLAAMQTRHLVVDHISPIIALNSGYQLAFALAAIFALSGAVLSVFIKEPVQQA